MKPTDTSTSELPMTTSFTLLNIEESLRPKEPVACMQCPIAIWQLNGHTLKCYCRILYTFVWETHEPGKITICDGPAMAAAQAQAKD